MQTSNIWNKHNLCRSKIVLFLLFTPFLLLAQGGEEIHNPNYDNQRIITYGFSIGFHTSNFVLNYSQDFVDKLDSVHSILPRQSIGFSLGFIINARAAEFLDLRITPKVGFYEYALEYNYLNADQRIEVEESTVVELPILAKYKSVRRKNSRMYLVGGFTPGFEASGTSNLEENAELLQINRFNVYAEFGFGLDLYYPLFKFSPEIRVSKGLINVLSADKNDLSEGIDRLSTSAIALYLHFQ